MSTASAPGDWRPDLSVPNLWRLLQFHAKSNPLCKRVMAQLPRPLLIVILATLAFRLINALTLFLAPGALTTTSAYMLIVYGLQLFSGLWYVLLMLLPMIYARWAYRLTYAGDPMLRSAPFSFNERLMGIVTPCILAYLVITAVNVAFSLLQSVAYLFIAPNQPRGQEALLAGALAQFIGLLAVLPGILAYCSFATTSILRHLLARTDWSHQPRRSAIYTLTPYAIRLAAFLCTGISGTLLNTLPWYFLGPSLGNRPEYARQFLFTLTQFGSLVFQIVVALLLFVVYRSLWRRDLPGARRLLFEPEATA